MYVYVSYLFLALTPNGDRGCLMSLSCLESQGCHLIPVSYLIFPFSTQFSFSIDIFMLTIYFPNFSPEVFTTFFVCLFRNSRFCTYFHAQLLYDGSLQVACAAGCHMTLVFTTKHTYHYIVYVHFLVFLFLMPFLFNLILIIQTEQPTVPVYFGCISFLTRVISKRLMHRKFLSGVCVICVLFILVQGLTVGFELCVYLC